MSEYTISFEEALKIVVNGEGWVQGENYREGVILRLNCFSKYVEVYCFGHGNQHPLHIDKRCYMQKYKVVHTQPEAFGKGD